MDLASGYWQVDLSPEDREKAALITSEGLFEPTQMPQGLCNAPATFQRAMDSILRDLKLSCVLVYLDDITVFSSTFTAHLEHLRAVFEKIRAAGLKLKPSKCSFFKDRLEFLGHEVSRTGIKPMMNKVEAIDKMLPPTSLRDVQVFLGMMGYYRQFIPDFARLSEPLVQLLRGVPFDWGPEQQASFESLKATLKAAPILVYPDFDKEFVLYTDASNLAIGAILAQLDENGVDHPIAYASRVLNKHERNYSVTEKECLAVIFAVKQFRPYVYGTHFTVITDHSSLRWLQQLKEPEGRLARWALKLQGYNFTILHRAGAQHQNADGLSRMPILALHPAEADRLYELLGHPESWEHEPEYTRSALAKLSKDTSIVDRQLVKKVGRRLLPYIRPSQRPSLILQGHRHTGHSGLRKTLDYLEKRYYWEGMRASIPDVLSACHECQIQRPRPSSHEFKLILPQHAFHTVSIDAVGPFPRSRSGNRFILIAIDHFSKWVEAKATRDISARTTATFLLSDIFCRHGCPQTLLSDNGTNFNAKLVTSLVELLGVHQDFAAPYNPSTNGAVERANSTLVSVLRKLASRDTGNWDTYLPAALFAYRLSIHRITKQSPFAMLYGREATTPSLVFPALSAQDAAVDPDKHVQELAGKIIELQTLAYNATLRTKTMELTPTSSRSPVPEFKIGDLVLYYQNRVGGRAHKLDSLWIGPFEVTFRRGPEYSIKLLSSGRPLSRIHAKFLKLYTPPESNLEGGHVGNSTFTGDSIRLVNGIPADDSYFAPLAFRFHDEPVEGSRAP